MAIQPHFIHVHNYHLDGYGHVNNARYLEFLEEARWHFFRQAGLHQALREVQLVVARVDIAYRQAAVHDDVLAITSELLTVQSRQVIMRQTVRITANQRIAAQAEITLMPTRDGRVFRLPDDLLQSLSDLREEGGT